MNLAPNLKLTLLKAGQAAATSQVDSDILDMQGYDGVLFLTSIAVANAGNYLKATQGNDSGLSDGADLAGSKVVPDTNAMGAWLEVYRPTDRYLRLSIIRAGASTASGDIWALQYSGRKKSVSNIVATKLIGELWNSPAEGTI